MNTIRVFPGTWIYITLVTYWAIISPSLTPTTKKNSDENMSNDLYGQSAYGDEVVTTENAIEKKKKKTEFVVYKYSQLGTGDLHEAVIIDGLPYFMKYNFDSKRKCPCVILPFIICTLELLDVLGPYKTVKPLKAGTSRFDPFLFTE